MGQVRAELNLPLPFRSRNSMGSPSSPFPIDSTIFRVSVFRDRFFLRYFFRTSKRSRMVTSVVDEMQPAKIDASVFVVKQHAEGEKEGRGKEEVNIVFVWSKPLRKRMPLWERSGCSIRNEISSWVKGSSRRARWSHARLRGSLRVALQFLTPLTYFGDDVTREESKI